MVGRGGIGGRHARVGVLYARLPDAQL